MSMQRVELGITAHPENFGVLELARLLKPIERRLKPAQGAMHQRQVIRRDVASGSKLIQLLQSVFSPSHIARDSVRRAEPTQRVGGFAHYLDTFLCVGNCFLVPAQPAEQEA